MANALNDGLSIPDQIDQGLGYQAGSFIASGATSLILFSPSFLGTPVVQVTMAQSGTLFPYISGNSVSTGSANIATVSGTAQLYHWSAYGNL